MDWLIDWLIDFVELFYLFFFIPQLFLVAVFYDSHLEVSIDSSDHKELLELLGTLCQRIKFAVLLRRYEEFAGAARCPPKKIRRLHVDETVVVVKKLAHFHG